MNTGITTITKNANLVTLIEVLQVAPNKQQEVMASMSKANEYLMQQAGFISLSLHRSLDGAYVVNYVQWENRELLNAAQQKREFQHYHVSYQNLIMNATSDLYDVVYTDDYSSRGVTTITKDEQIATFINVISTTPERQQALLEFVIGNDTKVFATARGYRSANFHRSHDGSHVINYSHWDGEQAFLDAINVLFKLPNLTMEQANQLATTQAGGVGTTNFRFYDVVFSAHV